MSLRTPRICAGMACKDYAAYPRIACEQCAKMRDGNGAYPSSGYNRYVVDKMELPEREEGAKKVKR